MFKKKNLLFLIYIFSAATIISLFNYFNPGDLYYSWYRVGVVENLTNQIRNGEMPAFLAQTEHSWGFALYLPYLAYLFNVQDFYAFFLVLHIIATWIMLVLFPIEIRKITKNDLAACLSPVILHIFAGDILYGYKTETMWTGGYALVLGAPLLYQYLKAQKTKDRRKLIIWIGLLCSCCNVLRNQSSFSTIILSVIILIISMVTEIRKNCTATEKRRFVWLPFLIDMVLLIFLSELICTFIPYLLGIILGTEILNNSGFVWHSILCGLGVVENPYGFLWSDDTIMTIVGKKYNLSWGYSNEYFDCCKKYFFEILHNDSGFIFSTYLWKYGRCWELIYKGLSNGFYGAPSFFSSINLHRVLIPGIITGIGSCAYVLYEVIQKKIKTGRVLACLLIWFLVISAGQIQGLLGFVDDYRYYTAGIAAVCMIPVLGIIYIVCRISKEKNESNA